MQPEARNRTAIGRLEVSIIIGVIAVASIGIVGYYSPITNPPAFSHTFRTSINYSGGWKEYYFSYNSLGKPPPGAADTNGTSLGSGPSTGGTITASGPDTGWTLCVIAEKLDPSNATLVVGIDGMTDETSLPYGHATVCEGVAG